jgi:hypothetical protein
MDASDAVVGLDARETDLVGLGAVYRVLDVGVAHAWGSRSCQSRFAVPAPPAWLDPPLVKTISNGLTAGSVGTTVLCTTGSTWSGARRRSTDPSEVRALSWEPLALCPPRLLILARGLARGFSSAERADSPADAMPRDSGMPPRRRLRMSEYACHGNVLLCK